MPFSQTVARAIHGHRLEMLLAGLLAAGPLLTLGPLTAAKGQDAAGEPPPALSKVKASLVALGEVADYQCILHKRERIGGKLSELETMTLRLRHEPFSVYLRYQLPKKVEGQEVLYVDGRNDGKMLAHPGGLRGKIVGTVALKTTGRMAMEGNRYPITELGMKRMAESWLREYERDSKLVPCDTRAMAGAKVNGRTCACAEAVRRQRHRDAPFQFTRLYIDDEMGLPVRYEAYEWNPDPKGKPLLAEEYTYVDLRFDNAFGDDDFDEKNPEYGF